MNTLPDQESSGWLGNRGFGGLDWASQKHSIVVVDPQGKVVEDFEIEHSALGWKKFRERIKPYGSIPFAIETSQGAAVEQLLEAGMLVYPLNPKSAQAYRQRKAPSGVKDDRLDAWSFADALRVDGHGWKPLQPEDPLICGCAFHKLLPVTRWWPLNENASPLTAKARQSGLIGHSY